MTPNGIEPGLRMHRARAVVATFNPPAELVAVVEGLAHDGVPVLVVDDASSEPEVLDACEKAGAEVRRMPTNAGIGRGLNVGVKWLLGSDAEFLVTLDQDTSLPSGYVQALVDHYDKRSRLGERLGVVGPASVNGRLVTSARPSSDGGMSAVVTIQSGSLFPAVAFRELGLFREDFIMDCIDHDYCLRVRRWGGVVALVPDLAIGHALGDPSIARFMGRPVRIGGKVRHVSNHSPTRRYYMTRNSLMLTWWNKRDVRWLGFMLRYHLRDMVAGLLFESDPRPKRAAFREGVRDAVRGRSGRRGATVAARRAA